MGEFLLSILGFDADGTVIYTRRLKGGQYRVGDAVPFVYPNQHRETKRSYYRILEKFYAPEIIVELIKTQDASVVDQNGYVLYQRRLTGKKMHELASTGHSFQQIGHEYGWHRHAVEHAIKLYKAWQHEQDVNEPHIEVYDMELLKDYIPEDNETYLIPEHLSAEEKTKREAILAQWD